MRSGTHSTKRLPVRQQHIDAMLDYARGVVSERIPACHWVRMATQRFLDDLQRAKKDNWPYRFDDGRAWRVIYFLEALPHVKGQWARRQERLTLGGWQKFIVGQAFGWVHKDTGLRRFRTVYIEVPRKNAKSTLTAGICVYMVGLDGEAGSEVYSAATKRDQARIVFDDARQMVLRSPPLAKRYGIEAKSHSILQESTNSKFIPLSSDSSSLDGLNIHFSAVDEVHAHKNRGLYDVLESGTGSRDQSIIWNITTAGSNKIGICYELRTYLTKVLDGLIEDDTFLGVIYTIDENDDWLDKKSWQKANPNYGVSVLPADVERLATKAAATPAAQANFLTKRLNIWVNANAPWMDMLAWDLCRDASIRPDHFRDCPCFLGLDLASRVDPAALVAVFVRDEKFYVFGWYYMPEDTVMTNATTTHAHYVGWAREDKLTIIPGPVIDQDVLEADILQLNEVYDVQSLAYDPWQATQLARNLHANGVNTVEVRPGVKNFSEPMKQLEGYVKERRIVHDGNPVLTWMASNVIAHLNAKDEIYPRKEVASSKIDGIIALIMCINRILADEGPLPVPTISVYSGSIA